MVHLSADGNGGGCGGGVGDQWLDTAGADVVGMAGAGNGPNVVEEYAGGPRAGLLINRCAGTDAKFLCAEEILSGSGECKGWTNAPVNSPT